MNNICQGRKKIIAPQFVNRRRETSFFVGMMPTTLAGRVVGLFNLEAGMKKKDQWYLGQQIEVRKYERDKKDWWFPIIVGLTILFGLGAILFSCRSDEVYAAEVWKITSYCACQKCCGPNAQGITASGKKVSEGMVACNWLPFGTKVNIEGLGVFSVQDRGAKSLFGSKTNHIKHLDVFLPTHKQALKFGVKYLEVKII